jgi:hypothetical protein
VILSKSTLQLDVNVIKSIFESMKSTIYVLFFVSFPLFGWAQFEGFKEIESVATGDDKTLSYEVFPCDLQTKVIVERTASKGNNLKIEFKSYDDESIEKLSLTVGKGAYIRSFALDNHLVILMGTIKLLTKAVVISYEDRKLIEIEKNTIRGKFKPTKASFMSFKNADSFREMDNAIAFEDQGKLVLFDLSSKKIIPVDLKLKNSHLVHGFIPTETNGEAHIYSSRRGALKEIEILKINPNGTVEKRHIVDESFTKDIKTASLGFFEEAGNYYAAGLNLRGMKLYYYGNGKTSIKDFGFTSSDFLELSEGNEGSKRMAMGYGGACSVYRSHGKTFILNKFYKMTNIGSSYHTVVPVYKKFNCVILNNENDIVTQASFPIENISGHYKEFYATFNSENSTINYISSQFYSYTGMMVFSYNIEENEASGKMLIDGYIALPILIDSQHVFVFGLFKDGDPYNLQLTDEDKEAKMAYGILEF